MDHHEIAAPYPYYPAEQDPYYAYQVPQQQHLQQYLIQQQPHHQFTQPVYSSSPPHVSTMPIDPSPPPASPDIYDPLSPPISGSDTSADGLYNSSGQNSPSSSRGTSLVHRSSARYNPTPSPTSSSGRRRGRSHDSDEEDIMGAAYAENIANSRKEATRRQRIEAEQRRRDELRDGYARLKDVLPVSNQKSSKVSLLERATHHIVALEKTNQDLQGRINVLEQELHRLRDLNEKISLNTGTSANETPSGVFDNRPLSPPPDVPLGVSPPSTPSEAGGGY